MENQLEFSTNSDRWTDRQTAKELRTKVCFVYSHLWCCCWFYTLHAAGTADRNLTNTIFQVFRTKSRLLLRLRFFRYRRGALCSSRRHCKKRSTCRDKSSLVEVKRKTKRRKTRKRNLRKEEVSAVNASGGGDSKQTKWVRLRNSVRL